MNNFTSMVIALLEHIKLISSADAEKLATEIHTATLPGTYKEARIVIGEIFKKLDLEDLPAHVEKIVNSLATDTKAEVGKTLPKKK